MAVQPPRAIGALMIVSVLAVAGCTSGQPRAAAPASPSSATTTSPGSVRPGQAASSAATARPSAGKSPAKASATAKPKRTSTAGGVEAPTPAGGVGPCKITTAHDVGAAYHGKVASETATTSGIGNPLCMFTLSGSNVGAPGTVTVTVNTSLSPAAFAQTKRHATGATSVAVGDSAFYVAESGTLQFIKGDTAAVIQANLHVPGAKPPKPSQLLADTLTLSRTIAADL